VRIGAPQCNVCTGRSRRSYRRWLMRTACLGIGYGCWLLAAAVLALTFDIDASDGVAGSRRTKPRRNYSLVDFFDLRTRMSWQFDLVRLQNLGFTQS